MGVVLGVAFTTWVWLGVWLPVPNLGSEKLATMHLTSELSEVECQHHETAAATILICTEKRKGAGLINHSRDVL